MPLLTNDRSCKGNQPHRFKLSAQSWNSRGEERLQVWECAGCLAWFIAHWDDGWIVRDIWRGRS